MFDVNKHRHEYFCDFVTTIEGLMPAEICDRLASRVDAGIAACEVDLVLHDGLGTDAVSDLGGAYNHYIFKGQDVREKLPELTAVSTRFSLW